MRTIEIGGEAISFAANGLTPYLFKNIHKKDLLVTISKFGDGKSEDAEMGEVVDRLAFVMAMQASGKGFRELSQLTEDDFFEWIQNFGPMDIQNNSREIMSVYIDNARSDSKAKKEAARASEQ